MLYETLTDLLNNDPAAYEYFYALPAEMQTALLPAAVAGGAVSTQAPALAFYALCAADPMAWIAADAVLCVPLIRNILRMNYGYLHSSRM